jgi:hypothetical protein
MDAISKAANKADQSADRPLWFKISRDFLLLTLVLFGIYALIDPFHYKLTGPFHVQGKSIWGYIWQASFVSAITILVKYGQKTIGRTLKSKTYLHPDN